MTVLFETPVPLMIAGACVVIVGLALAQNGRRRSGLAAAGVGVLLAAGGWALDGAVETDREQIEAAVARLVADFAAGDGAAVSAAIAGSRPDLRLIAAAALKAVTVENQRLTDVSSEAAGDRGEARFRVNADFTVAGGVGFSGRRPTRWKLTYVREADGWKVSDASQLDPITGKRLDTFKRL